MEWIIFNEENAKAGVLPPERKLVLVQMNTTLVHSVHSDAIVVGYLRYAAGDINSPFFVTIGCVNIGEAYKWCDCLPNDFNFNNYPKSNYKEIFNV